MTPVLKLTFLKVEKIPCFYPLRHSKMRDGGYIENLLFSPRNPKLERVFKGIPIFFHLTVPKYASK